MYWSVLHHNLHSPGESQHFGFWTLKKNSLPTAELAGKFIFQAFPKTHCLLLINISIFPVITYIKDENYAGKPLSFAAFVRNVTQDWMCLLVDKIHLNILKVFWNLSLFYLTLTTTSLFRISGTTLPSSNRLERHQRMTH